MIYSDPTRSDYVMISGHEKEALKQWVLQASLDGATNNSTFPTILDRHVGEYRIVTANWAGWWDLKRQHNGGDTR